MSEKPGAQRATGYLLSAAGFAGMPAAGLTASDLNPRIADEEPGFVFEGHWRSQVSPICARTELICRLFPLSAHDPPPFSIRPPFFETQPSPSRAPPLFLATKPCYQDSIILDQDRPVKISARLRIRDAIGCRSGKACFAQEGTTDCVKTDGISASSF